MNSELEIVFAEDPSGVVLGELEIATLGGEDLPRAARLLEEEHYLGAARPVGRTLVQAVHHQGRWVALLVWGPAVTPTSSSRATSPPRCNTRWTWRRNSPPFYLRIRRTAPRPQGKADLQGLCDRAAAGGAAPHPHFGGDGKVRAQDHRGALQNHRQCDHQRLRPASLPHHAACGAEGYNFRFHPKKGMIP